MAESRVSMDLRLVGAALWRRRGSATLAILAVAIGVSVAAALLQVSRDISRQLRHELRALGPNLLLLPDATAESRGPTGRREESAGAWVDVAHARAGLDQAGLPAGPQLVLVARTASGPIQVIGADLAATWRLHPHWVLGDPARDTWMGARLRERLGVAAGDSVHAELDGRTLALPAGSPLEAGGPADDAWWVPIEAAQALAALPGRASLVESRFEGAAEDAAALAPRLARASGARVVPIGALTGTEAVLLERMRRLMTLVTVAALAAAGLCAFGTLTDLALERRRELALMKALGAGEGSIVRALTTEAAVIGLLGGLIGSGLGLFFAHLIGRRVFHTDIPPRPDVVPVVLALALGVAGLASIGPIRLARRTDPAVTLKGDG